MPRLGARPGKGRSVRPLAIALCVVALGAATAAGESLWSPDFKGYLAGRGFAKGDSIVIVIDTSSALSFSASNTDSKNLTLEFSGGEGGSLFSFLPQGRTGADLSTKGAEQYSLKGQVPATVMDVDTAGRGMVQGTRTIQLEGKEESLTLSGWVSPKDVNQKGQVALSRLADARLVFRTFLAPAQPVLTTADIQRIITQAAGAPALGTAPTAGQAGAAPTAGTTTTGTAPAAGGAQAVQPAGQTAQPTTTLSLTDAKKMELLLIYLNRLVDIIFAQ